MQCVYCGGTIVVSSCCLDFKSNADGYTIECSMCHIPYDFVQEKNNMFGYVAQYLIPVVFPQYKNVKNFMTKDQYEKEKLSHIILLNLYVPPYD